MEGEKGEGEMEKVRRDENTKQSGDRQIPRVREEANRQTEGKMRDIGGKLFLTAALSPFSEPNDKTSRFDVSGARLSQRKTSAVTQQPALLKQGQEETNRGEERG